MATNGDFANDPCHGTYKYAEIDWICEDNAGGNEIVQIAVQSNLKFYD